MNIAIDLRGLIHGKITGVTIYIIELLKAIFYADIKNNYFLYLNNYRKWDDQLVNKLPLNQKNIHFIRTKIPNKLLNLSLAVFSYPKLDELILKKLCKKGLKIDKIDLFFMPDPRPVALKKAKLITTFHDLSPIRFPQFFSLKARIFHKLINFAKIAQKSDKIIAVSKFTQKELQKILNIEAKKITVVYEGPGSKMPHLDEKETKYFEKKFSLPAKYFLFIGTLEPRKNLVELIASFKKLQQKNIKLLLIGEEDLKNFSKIKNIKLTDEKIIFLGNLTDKEKYFILKKAFALVFPSIYEGFGLPILEAYKCGIPVIVSNVSALPEIAENAAIYCDPTSPNSIHEAMALMLQNKYRQKLSDKIPKIIKKYSWEKTAKKMIKIFQNFFIFLFLNNL